MGLDGFSLGNLGLGTDLTSAQMASQSEHLAKKGTEFKIKDISKSVESAEVKIKDEDSNSKNQFDEFMNKKDNDDDDNDSESSISLEEFESQNLKEISVRINPQTEMVELFSNKSNRVIETMSANDLQALLSRLNSASGILVNRKI